MRRPTTVLLAGLLLACALLALTAAPARAHAALQETSPADGEVLEQAPEQVRLRFNEPVTLQPGGLRVLDSDGDRVDLGDADQVAPEEIAVGLPGDLPDGTYVTAWRTISADGHPIRGAFVFSVGEEGAAADEAVVTEILAAEEDLGWQVAATAGRWLYYATALLAAGGLLFLLWVHDRDEDERPTLVRIVSLAAVAGAVVSLAGVGLQAALATGLGLGAFASPDALGDVLGSSFGVATIVRVVGLLLVLLAARWLWTAPAAVVGVGGVLLTLGSFMLTGHTVTSEPRWLAAGANLAHTLFGAAWFGGLVLLAVVLRRRRRVDDAVGGGRMVARFSTYALATVAVVMAAGLALTWAEVRSLEGLWTTAYGITLLVKIAAVAAIGAVAAYNRQRLVPAIVGHDDQPRQGDASRRLTRTVGVESFGIVGVLLITALLTGMTPAREQIAAPFTGYVEMGQHEVNLTVDPARVGVNELHVYLLSSAGQPVDAAESATILMTHTEEDVGPIEREPTVAGPGHWTHTGPELSVAGTWEVTVRFQMSRFEEESATFSVDVRG